MKKITTIIILVGIFNLFFFLYNMYKPTPIPKSLPNKTFLCAMVMEDSTGWHHIKLVTNKDMVKVWERMGYKVLEED